MSKKIFIFLFLSLASFLATEEISELGTPDILPYLGQKEYNLTSGEINTLFLKLEISKIKENNYIYIDLMQRDPTRIKSFCYKILEKDDESQYKDGYKCIDHNGVINHSSQHTIYFKVYKDNINYNFLLIQIKASTTVNEQKLTVVHAESQFNIAIFIIIIMIVTWIITFSVIGITMYRLHKIKREPLPYNPGQVDPVNPNPVQEVSNIALISSN